MNNASNFNKTKNMTKYSSETPIKDRPRGVDFTFPGLDSSKVIRSYPVIITTGFQIRLLWDNEVIHFIKNCFIKLFSRRSSQLK